MSVKKLKNIPASVRARLFNEAVAQQRPFNEILQHYAMERFLYRLANSPHSRSFLLKGALMLRAVETKMSRPTMAIDLLGKVTNDHESLQRIVQDCISISVNDGMFFDAGSMELQDIVEGADYHGVRILFPAFLGTARISMQIDVGFGDKVTPRPMWIHYPELLDLGSPHLWAIPPETAIAEKLQVMVNLHRINSRMKDFYDIYLMSQHLDFKGEILVKAITTTFTNRKTGIPRDAPLALSTTFLDVPGKPLQWDGFVRRLRIDDALSLGQTITVLSDFLMPVLRTASANTSFNQLWSKGGPWHPKIPRGVE